MDPPTYATGRHCFRTKGLFYYFILLLTIRAAATPDWTDCDLPCRCKWASGKKTAICSSSGLTAIPYLNSELQVLDLHDNNIRILGKDAFSSMELLNLQKIFLRNASLVEIHRDAFHDLIILIELDLSYNELTFIHQGTFSGNDRLKILTLSGNPLKVLTNEQFPVLPHLRILDLENCQLTDIHGGAFVNLKLLENLNLKFNLLTNISRSLFEQLTSLKSLDLVGNPWNCDCTLRNFRNWYLSSNLHSLSLKCESPPGHVGRTWEEISSMEFACSPHIQIDRPVIEKKIGHNTTFACFVKGDPEPEVSWAFQGHTIGSVNSTRNNLSFLVEKEKYLDGKWVNLTLVNITESDAGVYVCQAKSYVVTISRNVTLYLSDSRFRSLTDANYLFIFIGLLLVGLLILALVFAVMACSCLTYSQQKTRKSHKKGKLKENQTIYDQEKHLINTSNSNEQYSSNKSSNELLSSHPSTELLRHGTPISNFETSHYIPRMTTGETSTVIRLSPPVANSFGVYPPPPEFSNNMPRSGTIGNIFISVALNEEPSVTVETYPDLLDAHRPSTSKSSTLYRGSFKNVNVIRNNNFSTLNPSSFNHGSMKPPRLMQNTGKFLNSDNGFHNIYKPPLPILNKPCSNSAETRNDSAVGANNLTSSFCSLSVAPYATLPRKQIVKIPEKPPDPAYDNMGKRVTIGGSSTLSLPDEYEAIPTPPPPPVAVKPENDFIPL